MSKKKLSKLPIEELTKKEKQYKMYFPLFIGLVVVMLIVLIGNIIEHDFDKGLLAFIPSVLASIGTRYELRNIQKEIKSRNL